MIKEAIATGATIDEAKENALAQLCADEGTDVKIEVLEMPEKKKFGLFGGSPAKVRAFYTVNPVESAAKFLTDVITLMGAEELVISPEEVEGGAVITVNCSDSSVVIGRHGDTLDALQYLTSLVVNKDTGDDYYRISLNTGSYREKREKSLSGYARKVAIGVTRTGKSVTLEPMNPYERRIIHTTVQGIKGATSHSVGEGADRKVVICLEEGFTPTGSRRSGGKNFRSKGKQGYRRGGRPYEKKAAQSEETVQREPHSDLKSAPLYGKIESLD